MKHLLIFVLIILGFSFAQSQHWYKIDGLNSGCDSFDWGKVIKSSGPLVTELKIINTSQNQSLKILNIKRGCGCTSTPLDKWVISPNDTATLGIELDISGYHGEIDKEIILMTNDPEKPTFKMHMKANVCPDIKRNTLHINFDNIRAGVESSSEIVFKNMTCSPVHVVKIKHNLKGLSLNIKPGTKIAANSDFTINATLLINEPGQIDEEIFIYTTHPKYKRITISVIGNIVGSLKADGL